jgi:hypothetical protein
LGEAVLQATALGRVRPGHADVELHGWDYGIGDIGYSDRLTEPGLVGGGWRTKMRH